MRQLEILHVEPEWIICHKAPGMECEKEIPQRLAAALGGTVADYFCIHRLDRTVGGVMVYTRTRAAAAALSAQIQRHTFEKCYLAICTGCPEPQSGLMQDYLYKDAARGRTYPVKGPRRGVKAAELAYQTRAATTLDGASISLVAVTLHTGRFHQIRAQFAARKMPLLGDGKYGSREKRCAIALYSCRIGFRHPQTGVPLSFTVTPPNTFPWTCFPETQRLAPTAIK